MRAPARAGTVAALVAAVAVLTASVTWTLGWPFQNHPGFSRFGSLQPAIDLPGPAAEVAGSVVDVIAMDMGERGMRGRPHPYMGGSMLLRANRVDVPSGTVTLRLYNAGSVQHELVILPLANDQQMGQRAVGPDGTVDESDNLGEASRPNGAGPGNGVDPGATGWVTVDLAPGRYEIVCNIKNHYAAGMYTVFVVD